MPSLVDGHDHFAYGWFDRSALEAAVRGERGKVWNDAPERTKEDVVLLLKYAGTGELNAWRRFLGR